jgi:hypothetical protein
MRVDDVHRRINGSGTVPQGYTGGGTMTRRPGVAYSSNSSQVPRNKSWCNRVGEYSVLAAAGFTVRFGR